MFARQNEDDAPFAVHEQYESCELVMILNQSMRDKTHMYIDIFSLQQQGQYSMEKKSTHTHTH